MANRYITHIQLITMKITDVQKELLTYVLFYVLYLIPILLVALIAC